MLSMTSPCAYFAAIPDDGMAWFHETVDLKNSLADGCKTRPQCILIPTVQIFLSKLDHYGQPRP